MLEGFLVSFLSGLAASLTDKVISTTYRKVRKDIKESHQEKALKHCFLAGLTAMAQDAIQPEFVEDYLKHVCAPFFEELDVVKELEKLLRSEQPDIETLKDVYLEIYEDDKILAQVSFEQSMVAFFKGFSDAADQKTELQGFITIGVLRNVVAVLKDIQGLTPSAGTQELRYLEGLITRCDSLELALDTAGKGEEDGKVSLDDVFTNLFLESLRKSDRASVADIIMKQGSHARLDKKEVSQDKGEPISASEAVAAVDRLVVLGQPGGGKSTLVNHLCIQLVHRRRGDVMKTGLMPGWEDLAPQLPVRIILRRFAAWRPGEGVEEGTAGHVWAYIKHQLGTWGVTEVFPFVREELKERGGVVFFDGLDEVSEEDESARRTLIKRAIEDFAKGEKKSKIVVTCREYAYRDKDRWRLNHNMFPVVNLALFNLDQIKGFLLAWYQAVGPLKEWNPETIKNKAAVLHQAIEQLPYLLELAQYPLLITLMAQVHGGEGYLPRDRADLYDKAVTLLLAVWDNRIVINVEESKGVDTAKVLRIDIPTDDLRKILADIAYKAHVRQETDEMRDESAADIPAEELRKGIAPYVDGLDKAQEAMDYIQFRAGVLVANDNYTYSFLHRTFQEYLAATYILQQSTHAEILENHLSSDIDWWREVFLLAAGDARYPVMVANLVDQLVPCVQGREELLPALSRRINLAAQALSETEFDKAALEEEKKKSGRYSETYRKILNWLVYAYRADGLDAVHRVACGEALARLGDPRLEVLRVEDMAFCEVPAGRFLMGSSEKDKEAHGNEKPQHEVELTYTYWISKYPVTIAQFRQYVEDSKIQPGDPQCLMGEATHPVVYVSWHEATAFCEWLTEKLKEEAKNKKVKAGIDAYWEGIKSGKLKAALPGEAEWEKAARGMKDDRIYPWRGEWQQEKCNNWDLPVKKVSTVGCFPGGASPVGAEDMVGNVWEWTRDWYGKQTYKGRDKEVMKDPAGPEEGTARVLRGGSFDSDSDFCRCAARLSSDPDFRYDFIGFRIVLPPSIR